MASNPTRYSALRLTQLLDAQGRRLDWFADQLGKKVRNRPFDPSYVTKLRNGDKPITDEIAHASAAILQVPVDWLAEPLELREAVLA